MNISDELIAWYKTNRRDLPWRHTTDPYLIWLSEIILQQTRVEQGRPYYERFAGRFPTVAEFAAASEDEILKLWQGLGYYSRGRNMLKTALAVNVLYNGKFPINYDELIKLKGIGEYTAAAISSFSSNQAKAVVDGNVFRVLSRYFGIDTPINSTEGKRIFQKTANEVLNKDEPGLHNQAIMEFGAMLCRPQNPACGICPLRLDCYAFKHNAINALPVKLRKLKIRERFFNYLLIFNNDKILMNKRDEGDIWANMYDLPMIETDRPVTPEELKQLPEYREYWGNEMKILEMATPKKHVLTHQHLHVRFITLAQMPEEMKGSWIFIERRNLKKLPLPKVIFIFLDKFLN